jgi:MoaA/NifB/PqqE/SkfB family radical SAM enzyme
MKDIDLKDFKLILKDAKQEGIFDISLSGGEPFINKQILDYISYTQEMEFDISIVTNGTLLSNEIAKELANLNIINDIQISFDGHTPDIHNKSRGDFHNALNGFFRLCERSENKENSPSVGIVINKFNYYHLIDIILFFSNYTNRFHLMNVMNSDLSLADREKNEFLTNIIPELILLAKGKNIKLSIDMNRCSNELLDIRINCLAGLTVLVISANLEIYPCDIARFKLGDWKGIGSLSRAFQKSKAIWNNLTHPWCEVGIHNDNKLSR